MLDVVDLSRLQFALTALYHFIFVPLTLGLSFVLVIMETIYVKTGKEVYKDMTKFWGKLFGINFALGVTTGIIMEFQFGTNWSYYSHYVGDIFGAPLAIEGILAFFMEATFIAVMFFGWNKVSKRFHLASTWLTGIGATLSAWWILVANAWMQYPVGMTFNPDTGRSEMADFWSILFSPVAVNKFLHTISSGYITGGLFVMAVSAWFMIKGREVLFARRSMIVGATFGLIAALFVALTGDGSAYQVAQKQPAKLAAMEGLFHGTDHAGLTVIGVLKPEAGQGAPEDDYYFKWEIPSMLSLLGYRSADAFVPGVHDLVNGNPAQGIPSAQSRIDTGRVALAALDCYRLAKKSGATHQLDSIRAVLMENYPSMGYGYFNNPRDIIPNVPMTFYTFHLMVLLGGWFILLCALVLFLLVFRSVEKKRFLLLLIIFTFPLAFAASWSGWIVAEVGRQPWAIQDLMPVSVATTHLNTQSVIITFCLFAVLFTALLIAEIKIMLTAIKNGPKGEQHV